MTYPLLANHPEFLLPATYTLLGLVALASGFIVGFVAGRAGARWAAIASGLFVLHMIVYLDSTVLGWTPQGTVFAVFLGAPLAVVAAIGGKLGEGASRGSARAFALTMTAAILVICASGTTIWVNTKIATARFRKNTFPVIRANLDAQVMRLPADTRWSVSWSDERIIVLQATHRTIDHLYIGVRPKGEEITDFSYANARAGQVMLTDLSSAKAYLREAGFSGKVADRLTHGSTGLESWFSANDLLPNPQRSKRQGHWKPGDEVRIDLEPDGFISVYL
jgi:hypothetical protein